MLDNTPSGAIVVVIVLIPFIPALQGGFFVEYLGPYIPKSYNVYYAPPYLFTSFGGVDTSLSGFIPLFLASMGGAWACKLA
jgi:hypothetical protein